MDDDKLIEYLRQIFPGLDDPGRALVAQHMERKEMAPYRNLYQQAEPSRAFYVIHTGRVSSAGTDARPVFTSTAGNALGEQDFFRGEPRGFTARAESKTVYWEMTEAHFLRVLHTQPAVGLQIEGDRIAQLDLYLRDRLAAVPVLDGLGPDILLAMARLFAPRTLQAGEHLYRQGESVQGLFLTDQGRLAQADTGAPIPPGTLQGADALRTDSPYVHDVVAQEPVLCWMLSRGDFQRLQAAHPTLPRALGRGASPAPPPAEARALSLLSRSAPLSALPPDILQALAAQAFGRRLRAGDAVYRTQDVSDAFFLLVTGEIELSQASATGVNQELSRVAAGDVFGLESLLRTAPRTQQATATVDTELLVFTREVLENLRGTHDAVAQWWAQAAPSAPEAGGSGSGAAHVDLGDLSMFSVFTGLSGPEAARVLPKLQEARFFPQEQIYAKGDELAYLYCVQEGTVQLEREATEGPRTAGPGSLLGLVSLMAQQPCPEHAFASTEVRLVTLSRADVQQLSRDVPRFGENLWRVATDAPAAPPPPPVTPPPVSPYSQPPPAPPGRAPATPYSPPPAPPAPTGGAPPSRQNEPFLPLDPVPAPPDSGWKELAALSWAGKIRFLFTLLALLYLLATLAAQILPADIMDTLFGLFG